MSESTSPTSSTIAQHPACALTVREMLETVSVASIAMPRSGDNIGEPMMCAGVNPLVLYRAPLNKPLCVDVYDLDNRAALFVIMLQLLRMFGEISPGRRDVFGVFEDRSEGVVIFLPAPRNTDKVPNLPPDGVPD